MKVYDPSRIRNVVLLGHSGSGKTTLAETMMYESGAIKRRGSIEERNTLSDYQDIEHEKQKSVISSLLNMEWRGNKINLIDTPGTSDYIGQVIGSLRVSDTAIFTLNSEHGVEVSTEIYWKHAQKYNVPSIFTVNHLDHSKSDFQKTVDMAKERFGREATVIQYPYNEGEGFNAIIDVLKMTMYEFPEDGGKPDKLPIPESQKSQAELLHNELVEIVAENDESLMDIYFENGELDEYQMREGLQSALKQRQIFPIFCTSAKHNMGTGRIMGFLGNVAPSPLEANAPVDKNGEEVAIDPDGEPVVFLFKNHYESHVGDLIYFKVIRGTIQAGMDLVNSTSNNSVRLSSLYWSSGRKREEAGQIQTGDIGAAVKLKDANVNDTLHAKNSPVELHPIDFPNPTIRSAVRLSNEGDEEKLGSALHQLQREDPSFSIEHSQELKQAILHAQGEEHLAVIKYELENRYGLHIEYFRPKIPYRETITQSYRSHHRHKKQTGGAGQFAEVYMLIEPYEEGMPDPEDLNVRDVQEHDLPWGGKLVFQNCIVGGVIDNRFMPAIMKGIMEKMENGPMTGCRVRDIRVSVYDGSMHPVDSNDAAFKMAAAVAFKQGFMKCEPQLLEPVYLVEVTVPDDYMGDVMSDLSTRRGQIQGTDSEGSFQKIKAEVPLAELDYYSTKLKSITQGRASHSREFSHYAPVPRNVQEEVIKENRELEEA